MGGSRKRRRDEERSCQLCTSCIENAIIWIKATSHQEGKGRREMDSNAYIGALDFNLALAFIRMGGSYS